MCTQRPLFKCQGQLKFKFAFLFANVSKEINAILMLGINSFISEVKKKFLTYVSHRTSYLSRNACNQPCGEIVFYSYFSFFLIWD